MPDTGSRADPQLIRLLALDLSEAFEFFLGEFASSLPREFILLAFGDAPGVPGSSGDDRIDGLSFASAVLFFASANEAAASANEANGLAAEVADLCRRSALRTREGSQYSESSRRRHGLTFLNAR